jgi:membrane protein YqaA with SNARE-associated domain
VKLHPIIWLHKGSAWTMAILKPLGFWGLGGLSFVDAGLFPIPPTMDLVVIEYVTTNPRRLVLYCFVAALGSALGCLIPFFVGRAGGELFLLKRINRERFEQIRDRFEKQEFLAIAIPAMIPPPFPLKVFEFAAGVFEMKPLLFATAIFCGKFVRFLIFAIITVLYGPTILHSFTHELHRHFEVVLGLAGVLVLALVAYVLRRVFDKRRGTPLPVEDDEPLG